MELEIASSVISRAQRITVASSLSYGEGFVFKGYESRSGRKPVEEKWRNRIRQQRRDYDSVWELWTEVEGRQLFCTISMC